MSIVSKSLKVTATQVLIHQIRTNGHQGSTIGFTISPDASEELMDKWAKSLKTLGPIRFGQVVVHPDVAVYNTTLSANPPPQTSPPVMTLTGFHKACQVLNKRESYMQVRALGMVHSQLQADYVKLGEYQGKIRHMISTIASVKPETIYVVDNKEGSIISQFAFYSDGSAQEELKQIEYENLWGAAVAHKDPRIADILGEIDYTYPPTTRNVSFTSPPPTVSSSTTRAPATTVKSSEDEGANVAAIVVGVIGGVIVLLLVASLIYYCFVRKKKQQAAAMKAPSSVSTVHANGRRQTVDAATPGARSPDGLREINVRGGATPGRV